MRVDYGYFEGDHLGKPYDISLMRRLFTYAKPYRFIIGVSIVLILFVTGFELLFPYLIKVAIDDYIVVSARKVTLSSRSSPLQRMSTPLLAATPPQSLKSCTTGNGHTQAGVQERWNTSISGVPTGERRIWTMTPAFRRTPSGRTVSNGDRGRVRMMKELCA